MSKALEVGMLGFISHSPMPDNGPKPKESKYAHAATVRFVQSSLVLPLWKKVVIVCYYDCPITM